jgi:hypothetical protein
MHEQQPLSPQPRWQTLVAHFLQRQQQFPDMPMSEVELYQAQPALSLEPAATWPDALLPGALLAVPGSWEEVACAPAWAVQLRTLQWSAPFPCCLGLVPQCLQKVAPLLQDVRTFFQNPLRLGSSTGSMGDETAPLVSRLAAARVAGDDALVRELIPGIGQSFGSVCQENESASQAWLRGEYEEAEKRWNTLSGEHPVVALNQALAMLRRGAIASGRSSLEQARTGFAATSGWNHLAELYLAALATVSLATI